MFTCETLKKGIRHLVKPGGQEDCIEVGTTKYVGIFSLFSLRFSGDVFHVLAKCFMPGCWNSALEVGKESRVLETCRLSIPTCIPEPHFSYDHLSLNHSEKMPRTYLA